MNHHVARAVVLAAAPLAAALLSSTATALADDSCGFLCILPPPIPNLSLIDVYTTPSTTDTLTTISDPYEVSLYGGDGEEISSTSGIPPLYEQADGSKLIDVEDVTATTVATDGLPQVVGDYEVNVSSIDAGWFNNVQEVVTANDPLGLDAMGVAGIDAPPVGSVFDTATFGSGSFEITNTYADLVGEGTSGANLITDLLTIPGIGSIDIPTDFDASAFLDALGNFG